MSVASPTLLPRSALFPNLLPKPPQPHPIPLPPYGQKPLRFNATRDLVREMDDLSDEEEEMDELNIDLKNRGFNFLVPIGKMLTQHEEKNDADDDGDDDDDDDDDDDEEDEEDDDGEDRDETSPSEDNSDEDEDGDEQDLDAEMEDMDDDSGNITTRSDEMDESGYDEAPSSEP